GGVEGGKQLVFGKYIALADDVHQCGFTHVGIPYQGYSYQLTTVPALHFHLPVYGLQFLLQKGYLVPYNTSVGLNLGFPRTTHPDTPTLSFKVGPQACQPWKHVLQLGQLHLGAGITGLGPLGEDVEDQGGAVKHLAFYNSLN